MAKIKLPEPGMNEAQLAISSLLTRGKSRKDITDMFGCNASSISKIYNGVLTKGKYFNMLCAWSMVDKVISDYPSVEDEITAQQEEDFKFENDEMKAWTFISAAFITAIAVAVVYTIISLLK